MSKVADMVTEGITPVLNEMGYRIVEVEYAKKYDNMNLTVFIAHEEYKKPITLDDCERAHNTIDPILDELDPTEGKAYVLNVSSPGLDRPLKTDEDYKRMLGEKIEASLYTLVDKKKKFVGVLEAFDGDTVTVGGKVLERKNISVARMYIEFK